MWAAAVWLHLELGKQVFRISEVWLQACHIQVLLERKRIMEDARFPGKILLKPKLYIFKGISFLIKCSIPFVDNHINIHGAIYIVSMLMILYFQSNTCCSLSMLHSYCVLSKDAMGKCLFFSWTEALFNHAVKLHGHWFAQCVKNEPMATKPTRAC